MQAFMLKASKYESVKSPFSLTSTCPTFQARPQVNFEFRAVHFLHDRFPRRASIGVWIVCGIYASCLFVLDSFICDLELYAHLSSVY